jgi:hypothetical protein
MKKINRDFPQIYCNTVQKRKQSTCSVQKNKVFCDFFVLLVIYYIISPNVHLRLRSFYYFNARDSSSGERIQSLLKGQNSIIKGKNNP